MEPFEHKWDVQFRKGTLEMVILALLGQKAQFGLQLLQNLHQFETMKITEGTLYPLLDRLKRDGVVESYWLQEGESRPRKYYRLSDVGKDRLGGLKARWLKSVKDINQLFHKYNLEK
ncbi:PadR family transcriptional regulator [Microbulbifer spongiae]|uniref:PadR family transcriptional regulator n=1 Tax=Microbulbifer spongiae TaxID=2944933 RepID=A0ABY9EHF1_9GAMM|nr:PadR family transcriptional regulator [Microbulbifer sp. MI-G]WKD50286.1 PadR family transcriptional regulator [Microbulbifer sp. MI-G]